MKKKEEQLIEFIETEFAKRIELKNGILNCYIPEISIDELSKTLRVLTSSIVSFFWKSGYNITRNQPLNISLVTEYCNSRKITVQFISHLKLNQMVNEYLNSNEDKLEKISRIPVVSIMGHIDHGKSTTLDTICGTKNQQHEEGGITQKIKIYPVLFGGKKINFLDTPGHNIFMQMRERGAAFTDIVVLVIAAEDGIMPQTSEVIDHIHKYKIPTIVFINNKKSSTVFQSKSDWIKNQLQEKGLTSSEWEGGNTIVISGNATNKESANEILENIILLMEIYDWKVSRKGLVNGIVLDSYTSSKEGIVNIFLVKSGTLEKNHNIFINGEHGKIRKIIDFLGNELESTDPGEIVKVFGLSFQADLGESFFVLDNKALIKKIGRMIPSFSENKILSNQTRQEKNSTNRKVNLILIAESQSSLEALVNITHKSSSNDISFNIIQAEVGDINESLISIAKITESSFLLFNIKPNHYTTKELLENNIEWSANSIIYKVGDDLKALVESLREKRKVEKKMGIAEVKKVFSYSQVGKIAGCNVIDGSINRNCMVSIIRQNKKIFTGGKILSLQRDRINMREVLKNQECGIVINGFNEFEIGDQMIAYMLIDEN